MIRAFTKEKYYRLPTVESLNGIKVNFLSVTLAERYGNAAIEPGKKYWVIFNKEDVMQLSGLRLGRCSVIEAKH